MSDGSKEGFVRRTVALEDRWFSARCQGGVDDISQEVKQISSDGTGGGEGRGFKRAEVKSAHGNFFKASFRMGRAGH